MIKYLRFNYFLFAFYLLSSLVTISLAQTTVTGTIQDPSGAVATSGYVMFSLTPSLSNVQYYISGTAIITPRSVNCNINGSGLILNSALSGPCLIWSNALITPTNTSYTITYFPNGIRNASISNYLITGSTYSLNSPVFQPTISPSPQGSSIYTSPVNWNIIPSANNVFTLGSANLGYLSAFINTITTSNISMIKTISQAGCLSGSSAFATCNSTVTWGSPWADNNYTVTCSITAVAAGVPLIAQIGTKTTTGFTLYMMPATAAVSQGTVNCTGVHN